MLYKAIGHIDDLAQAYRLVNPNTFHKADISNLVIMPKRGSSPDLEVLLALDHRPVLELQLRNTGILRSILDEFQHRLHAPILALNLAVDLAQHLAPGFRRVCCNSP